MIVKKLIKSYSSLKYFHIQENNSILKKNPSPSCVLNIEDSLGVQRFKIRKHLERNSFFATIITRVPQKELGFQDFRVLNTKKLVLANFDCVTHAT
jgi:hypothetical protein